MDIGSLKVGDKITFGAYTCAPDVAPPAPITWIKASRNCDFISETAVDFLIYDAPEGPLGGNPIFHLSNMFLFLNGGIWDPWWHKSHDKDRKPEAYVVQRAIRPPQYGFMRDFAQHEIDAIIPTTLDIEGAVPSLIRLPSVDEIFSKEFDYFKRHGVRARWSDDVLRYKQGYIHTKSLSSYAEYWTRSCETMTQSSDYDGVVTVSRNATAGCKVAHLGAGVRPVCTINPNTPVELYLDKYRIQDEGYRNNINREIMSLIE